MRINWGHGIAAIYTTFACSTLGFVLFAVGHPAELVSADYYQRSIAHDSRAAARDRAAALGDRLEARVIGDHIAIAIPASSSGAVTGRATLYRASNSGLDRSWPLALDGEGRQVVSVAGLASGHWVLQLDWTTDGLAFYGERAVRLP